MPASSASLAAELNPKETSATPHLPTMTTSAHCMSRFFAVAVQLLLIYSAIARAEAPTPEPTFDSNAVEGDLESNNAPAAVDLIKRSVVPEVATGTPPSNT